MRAWLFCRKSYKNAEKLERNILSDNSCVRNVTL
jgi:hypothetical protein